MNTGCPLRLLFSSVFETKSAVGNLTELTYLLKQAS